MQFLTNISFRHIVIPVQCLKSRAVDSAPIMYLVCRNLVLFERGLCVNIAVCDDDMPHPEET